MVEITKDLFEPIGEDENSSEAINRPSITYWQDAWRRLKMNKVAMIGLVLLAIFTLMAVFAPYMTKYTYNQNNLDFVNQLPNKDHWFGTDGLGRDLWARV